MSPARLVLTNVANALTAAVLSPGCAACGRALDRPCAGPVCALCWNAIRVPTPPLCRVCGDSLPSWRTLGLTTGLCAACRRRSRWIDLGRASGRYEGSLREIIHAFKYEGRRSLARPLGALMRQAGQDLLDGASCAVPVPLHPWRRFVRGFNQASDLAGELGLPVVSALRRERATAPQSGLAGAARHRNVRGAFRPSPFVPRRVRRSLLADRTVILVDDVATTGATLDACARALKEAGVREVRALTAARATIR
jgi:ComF family protein